MADQDPRDIARDLHMLSALTQRVLEQGAEVGEAPVSFQQLTLLRWLGSGPRRAQDVARFLSVTPSAATQLVARLEARGLVRRRPDPSDQRAEGLVASARAQELVRREAELETQRVARLLQALPAADRASLRRGLRAGIEMLLGADPAQVDLCLHCTALASPQCVLRARGRACPTERPRRKPRSA
jgi:DNA-binding MarR family transcriptional regulator